MGKLSISALAVMAGAVALHAPSCFGEDSDAEIAKKLSNPVSSLISVPFQSNYDFGLGPSHDGRQYKLNFQPVIPLDAGANWTVIVRTIVPYISQKDVFKTDLPEVPTPPDIVTDSITTSRRRTFLATSSLAPVDRYQDGLGDVAQSVFLSPKHFGPEGLKLGFGPAFSYPTATDDRLGSKQWSAGPTGLVLMQTHGFTVGLLASHLWSFAGNGDRGNVNATSLQPFLSYQTKTRTTFGVNAESAYDWTASQWTVPLNFTVSQLVRVGKLPVSLQLGARVYVVKPDGGPEWGLRSSVTFVLPEGRPHPALSRPPASGK